jgi:methanethiol S-methyltransferase
MKDDMLLLIWILGIGIYYFIHSFLVLENVKKKIIRKFKNKKSYRISYNLISIILLIPLVWIYSKLEPDFLFESIVLKLIGFTIFSIGGILMVVSFKNYDIGEFTGILYLKENHEPTRSSLKTSGLNRIVRHPLYFAGLLILWGVFLFHPITKVLAMTAISTLYLIIGTKLEEKKLIATFGQEYETYKKHVPMLLPFLKF